MNNGLKNIAGFPKISLSELNSQSSFLSRFENKYILSKNDMNKLIDELGKKYYVLKMDGKYVFNYESVHMDTSNYEFYYQHQHKHKNKTKVRTRLYCDTKKSFFECKQKKSRITRKFRYEFPTKEHGTMTKGKTRFFEGVYMSLYGSLPKSISPSIKSNYKRITLVSKEGTDRITIDYDLSLKDLRNEKRSARRFKNLVILETKSSKENCTGRKILEKNGFKRAKNCSKYCLGLIYNNLSFEPGIFEDTMKKIEKLEK